MTKLKGCRALETVQIDFTNTCAAYGAAQYRIKSLDKEMLKLRERLDEIQLELNEAREQEAKLKEATPTETVSPPALEVVQ